MGYKKEDPIQSLEEIEVPNTLEKFIDELPDRYNSGDINIEVEEQVDKEWSLFKNNLKKKQNGVIRKRITVFTLSAVAAFGLFVGTAFVSPAVAKMASNIPYLNLIFENKIEVMSVGEEINRALYENKFMNINAHVDYKTKYIEVMIFEPEEYYNEVKEPIEKLIQDILKARNEEEYSFKVLNDAETGRIWKEMAENPSEEALEFDKITALVYEVLEPYGHVSLGMENGVRDGVVFFELPKTETRTEEIKSDILETFKQENIEGYTVKILTYDPKIREREGRFMPLFDTIAKGLKAEKDFKVYSVGYTNNKYKDHFHIVIRTTVSSKDSAIENVVETIEKTVQDFLQSEDALKAIQDDRYQVVIYSEDDKKMKVLKN
ncbi:DUF4030 domain-containing protein [Cytobacillus sp. FJAT-54145]|uniref:DUF4030 domain-containing protein n=1 Tax=Cytobacillus spartinae TaxID=3299023 RepID=A0ABW6K961_9BACI